MREARLITAIKTPYLPNGKPDIDAYDRHLEQQIHHGVDGVIVGGTTGEGQLMSWDEHIMMIAHTKAVFGDAVCVIGNTGSNATREALHATSQGFIVGMDAALQINPYYGKTSKAGLQAHFNRCLEEGPAMIYNVPGRTGQDIPNEVVDELAKHENFLGVKECTGNERISRHASAGIKCWSGNDDEAHDARHTHGGFGVVSVTSNLIPGLYAKLMREESDKLNADLQVRPEQSCLSATVSGLARDVCLKRAFTFQCLKPTRHPRSRHPSRFRLSQTQHLSQCVLSALLCNAMHAMPSAQAHV